jgi:hypothetical protein
MVTPELARQAMAQQPVAPLLGEQLWIPDDKRWEAVLADRFVKLNLPIARYRSRLNKEKPGELYQKAPRFLFDWLPTLPCHFCPLFWH